MKKLLCWLAASAKVLLMLIVLTTSTFAADGTFNVTESWSVTVDNPDVSAHFTRTGVERGSVQIVNGDYKLINRTGADLGTANLAASISGNGATFSTRSEPVLYAFASGGLQFYAVVRLSFFVVLVPLQSDWGFSLFDKDDVYTSYGSSPSSLNGFGSARDGTGATYDVSSISSLVGFVDTTLPTLNITAPTPGQRLSNEVFTVRGKASDNDAVAQVFYQLNGDDWATALSTNGWTTWSADVTMTPGTNTVRAYAVDATGNISPTSSVSFVYVLSAPVEVQVNGKGTVNPNYNTQLLEIGRQYTVTATPGPGFAFTNWTGSQTTNKPALTFLMESNLAFTANFVDVQRPTVAITAPMLAQRWSNEVFAVRGKAGDNDQVTQVFYQLNGGDWTAALSTNGWTNWTADVMLTPGTNTVRAYAVDATGNLSLTNGVSFVYVLSAPLVARVNGKGTINPNYNGQLLEIGRNYTMTATATPGYTFTNWTGSQTTNKPTLTFLMASNLDFEANFLDIQKPTLTIAIPTANQRWSNELFTVQGKAHDNDQVAEALFQLNTNDWALASTTNSWTNWTTEVRLTPGTNVVRAYAVDATGNISPTNTVSMFYVVKAPLAVAINGKGTVNPNYNAQLLEIGRNYTMMAAATPGYAFTNWTGSQTTNKPALTFFMASNLVFNANFVDIQKPTLAITIPAGNQRWSNEVFTVQGKAQDNDQVAEVFYQLNANDWAMASTTNSWTNWTADVTLTPGTNTVRAYAVDATGNISPTNAVSFFYVVKAPLAVAINGKGTVNPNYNAQLLEIGRNYTMAATASAGYAFTNWTGSQTTNKSALTFMMASNLEFTANFVDVTRPTVAITAPTPNQRWSNAVFTVAGKAGDNAQVAQVYCQINTNDWAAGSTTNGWTNWAAEVTLTPGTNIFRAYAVDTTGNQSLTVSVSSFYVVDLPLVVQLNGKGIVNPNYNGQLLEVGRNYTMTAAAAAGYVFTNWTGSQTTNKPGLTFLMASNLDFTANFVDVVRPTVTITSPTPGQRWSNAVFSVRGRATDNAQVAQVFYQLNAADWAAASTTNGWTNWTATVTLTPGTNTVRAYAQDATGNISPTNSLSLVDVLGVPGALTLTNPPVLTIRLPSNHVTLTLVGGAGRSYLIQSSTNLLNWSDLTSVVPFAGSFQTNQPRTGGRMFFRAVSRQ